MGVRRWGTQQAGLSLCARAGACAWPSLPRASRPLGPYLCLINARWIPWS